MTKCRETDCLRKPAYPDQAFCERHQLRWEPAKARPARFVPPWLRHLKAKDTTGWAS